jgi:uncharacterized protein GlcG (DUF336 family)
MKKPAILLAGLVIAGSAALGGGIGRAEGQGNTARNGCRDLPSWEALRGALVAARHEANGGLNLDMWGTVVDRDGVVCAVAFTGRTRGDQWPGSRVISAQKANTANAFSLRTLALSTANLFTAVQPGGSLFGLQESNPVSTDVAYGGNPDKYGQSSDPMVGERIGGVNVFGGGVALYNRSRNVIGGLGVSGDTSCADHNIAYRTRATLALDYVPGGVSPDPLRRDNIVFDVAPQGDGAPIVGQMAGMSAGGFGHTSCHGYNTAGNETSAGFAAGLPQNR